MALRARLHSATISTRGSALWLLLTIQHICRLSMGHHTMNAPRTHHEPGITLRTSMANKEWQPSDCHANSRTCAHGSWMDGTGRVRSLAVSHSMRARTTVDLV